MFAKDVGCLVSEGSSGCGSATALETNHADAFVHAHLGKDTREGPHTTWESAWIDLGGEG